MIKLKGLHKSFGKIRAVRDLSAEIRKGKSSVWSGRTARARVRFFG